jgi:hypothetical protein
VRYQTAPGERVVQAEAVPLSDFEPGTPILLRLSDSSIFSVILTDPENGQGLVKPWVGPNTRRKSFPEMLSTIGTRSIPDHSVAFASEMEPVEDTVTWGVITFDEELVLRNDQHRGRCFYAGGTVESLDVSQSPADFTEQL